MNQSALRLFVRSIISEAKEKKVKEEPKKTMKKEEKAPKSSGKLVDLKKELAALKQYKEDISGTSKYNQKQLFLMSLPKLSNNGVLDLFFLLFPSEGKISFESSKSSIAIFLNLMYFF